MHPIVEIRNVTYSYSRADRPALCDINLTIQPGQFMAIVGPTGAGKSTLCYCLNGAVPRLFGGEMTGTVIVAGLDTFENEIPVMAQHVGLVVQNARNQLFNVCIEGEVAFGCENLGLPREVIRQRIQETLAFIGLEGLEEREPSSLSGGQQQRAAIACVLAMQPDVLVLDEPTSELDPVGSQQVMQIIARLNRELGKTIVLVSHDTEFIAQFADRLIVLDEGRLVGDGSPKEIFSQVDFLHQVRIQPPQVTEVAYKMRQRGCPIEEFPLTVEQAAQLFQQVPHGA